MAKSKKDIRAKKHLGQHFLHDAQIARRIADALQPKGSFKRCIEIGPGTGMMTQFLLPREDLDLLAFDVDQESVDYLKATYPDQAERFLLQDFLAADLPALAQDQQIGLCGNLPYNISSPIFFRLLEQHTRVPQAVFMIQKEVAQRIAAPHGNKTYGILSVLVQAYYDVELVFEVGPGAFTPPPKVDSAVLRMERKEKLPEVEFRKLKTVVKTAFNQRRKTLRNALKSLVLDISDYPQDYFSQRAEVLPVANFVKLAQRL